MIRKHGAGALFLLLAIFTFLFGDNLFQQVTGRSVFNTPEQVAISTSPVIATTIPTSSIESSTQTAQATVVFISVDDITSRIVGEDGEMQRLMNWWQEVEGGANDGTLDPTSSNPDEYCIGMAWNTEEYGYHVLLVFQQPTTIAFADGGWYIKVCIPGYISISPLDIGRIQADWLSKRYGIDNHPWQVRVN